MGQRVHERCRDGILANACTTTTAVIAIANPPTWSLGQWEPSRSPSTSITASTPDATTRIAAPTQRERKRTATASGRRPSRSVTSIAWPLGNESVWWAWGPSGGRS